MTDSDKLQQPWKEYIEDLYDMYNKPHVQDIHQTHMSKDHFSEFEALSELKMERQKVGIPAELLKALGAKGSYRYLQWNIH